MQPARSRLLRQLFVQAVILEHLHLPDLHPAVQTALKDIMQQQLGHHLARHVPLDLIVLRLDSQQSQAIVLQDFTRQNQGNRLAWLVLLARTAPRRD